MKFRKLTIASGVCAALAGVSGLANATITGVPGEALLVAGVVTGGPTNQVPMGQIETYIGLRVPITIGTDAVINTYTAPHTTVAGTTTVQTLADPRIYWTLYNQDSQKQEDGYCHVSPGDTVLWTTDQNVRNVQLQQRAGILSSGVQGVPDPVCGPSSRNRFGYVVFQTIPGADGMDAGFAFAGDAAVRIQPVGIGFAGVPVLPMADGADPLPAGSGIPVFTNEVITGNGTYGDGFATSPIRYSPIAAGIRLSDADANNGENVVTQMPLSGPAAGNQMALHVHWYPNNDPTRASFGDIFDDNEGHCSHVTPLPRQLNAWLYNYQLGAYQGPTLVPTATWGNAAGGLANAAPDANGGFVLDLIGQVLAQANGSTRYCVPPYWLPNAIVNVAAYPGAILGYEQYAVAEFNFGVDDGNVHAAGIQFAAMQNNQVPGWAVHNATDLGKQ
jgi:hypothetical protein